MSDEPTERDVEALAELRDWGRSLADADRALNIPGQHAMVQASSVGRDLIRYADRLTEAIAQARREGAAEALNEVENLLARPDFNWWQRPEDLRGSVLRLVAERAALRGDA